MVLSKRLQSDGCLTRRQFERIAPESGGESGGELTRCGIWLDKGDHLERRNWLAWNDSAEAIEIMKRGGKRGNHQRWHVRGLKPPSAKCEFCVAEGLLSPPDRVGISPFIGTRQDKTRQELVESLSDITSVPTTSLRAVAEDLEQRVATVDEARAELEAAGCDERTIASVLALVPNLRRVS